MDAILLKNVTKHFRKRTIRREYTTLKSELVQWLVRKKSRSAPSLFIDALKGIDLAIPQGRTVGIIGRNGSGKSTLLKIITGIYTPSSGTIDVNGRISALLDLGAGFHPDFSGRENILINGIILGMKASEVRARMDEIIAFSELGDFIDEPVRTYSSGMYMRLAFAVATHVDPEILIIDEILAVGDEHFGKKSMAKMAAFKKAGKTIVLVTHDLNTVQNWCDLAAWIDGGKIRLVGDPTFVVAQYRQAVAVAEAQADATGSSALSSPGGALPELPTPTHGRALGSETRTGNFKVEIDAARLLTGTGVESTTFDSEDALELQLDYVAKELLPGAGFAIELARADGTVVYATSTFVEKIVLPPSTEPRMIRLVFARLGLTEGSYVLNVTAQHQSGMVYDSHRAIQSFRVTSGVADRGIFRPPHRWVLEERLPVAKLRVS